MEEVQPQTPSPAMQNQFMRDETPMSMKDWLITLLLQAIPVVGFILLIVWAVDSNTNLNKQNWARASLIIFAIVIGIVILISILMFGVIAALFNESQRF
jgi:heme/copper-type cytochrome/quinol oxidase subunit 2